VKQNSLTKGVSVSIIAGFHKCLTFQVFGRVRAECV